MHHQASTPSIQPTRRGSALMTVVVLLITLTALAVSMTNITVMGVQEQTRRYDTVSLLMAAESATNAAISDLQQNYADRIANDLTKDRSDGTATEAEYTHVPDLTLYGAAELNGTTCEALITRLNTDATDPDLIAFLVQGTATVGDPDDPMSYRRTRVETTVMPAPQNIFKQALFAIEGYDFKGAAATDSWDSTAGPYGSGAGNGNEGDLASEGDITVQKPGNVSGQIIDNTEFPLPRFDYDDQLAAETGTITLINPSGGNPGTLDNGYVSSQVGSVLKLYQADSPYRASDINLSSGTVLVHGTVELYCDGPAIIKGTSAGIIQYFDSGSQLRVYQRDYSDTSTTESSWDNNGGILGSATGIVPYRKNSTYAVGDTVEYDGTSYTSLQNTNKDNQPDISGSWWSANGPAGDWDAHPEQLIIMTEYQGHLTMNGNGVFAGVFFAPWATIKFNGTFDFFGSVIAKRYDTSSTGTGNGTVNGTFDFHYDENLANLDLDLTARLVMVGWRTFDLGYHYSD